MQVKIKTDVLKNMIAKSIKGASNNKLIPITELMSLRMRDGVLTLITTDATNYLYVRESGIDGDDADVTISVNLFSRLISKFTCEYVTIKLNAELKILEVVGNGNYKMELPLDESGSLINYPDQLSSFDMNDETKVGVLKKSTIDVILNNIKPAIAVTLEVPCYTGCYVGTQIIGTDTYKIASLDKHIFTEPKLIGQEVLNLLDVMTEDSVLMYSVDDVLVFDSENCTVYSRTMDDIIEDFDFDGITSVVEQEYPFMCKLSKSNLLAVLDRLSLFVGVYDKNAVRISFTEDSLEISSKASTGVESVVYIEGKATSEFSADIDIELFMSQIKACTSESLEIQYGLDTSIKLVDQDSDVVHIVAFFTA